MEGEMEGRQGEGGGLTVGLLSIHQHRSLVQLDVIEQHVTVWVQGDAQSMLARGMTDLRGCLSL